jgi:lipase
MTATPPPDPDLLDVEVDGGTLRVARWSGREAGPSADPMAVLAVHGITASHRAWPGLAARLPGVDLIAPDLRGRGHSAALPGPYGLGRHVDDLVRVLDRLELPQAVLVGHSMGGFVVAELVARHPERVAGVVLVDGGLPFAPLLDQTPEQALTATLGPAIARLAMTFPDPQAYRDFWRRHPALAEHWGPLVQAYVDYDLTGEPPRLHSRVVTDAVRGDHLDMVGTGPMQALDRLGRAGRPVPFLRAPLGLLADPPGLYPADAVTGWVDRQPWLRPIEVAGVNHYTILFAEAGLTAVERAVRQVLPVRSG